MRFVHASHPDRVVRLAYCLNVHPARDLEELLDGLARVTLPLRERVASGREFGVGLYLSASVARALCEDRAGFARLESALCSAALDPFTFNAFPYGGFGESGLKQRVFEPAWWERARAEYTLDVATIANALRRRPGPISISTHTGAHSSALAPYSQRERLAQCAAIWRDVDGEMERRELHDLWLALEPEPDSLLGSLAELAAANLRPESLGRRVGACLDTCHAAVMFEDAHASVSRALGFCAGLGKLQFTSALALREPARNVRGRTALFDLDEPRYLHQLATRAPDGAVALQPDLGAARAAFDAGRSTVAGAAEWRCHFHVPVNLESLAHLGLEVTSAFADDVLERVLARPEDWLGGELHVEIETYTWSILPRAARGAGELVDGLEREYEHVIAQLERAGWRSG